MSGANTFILSEMINYFCSIDTDCQATSGHYTAFVLGPQWWSSNNWEIVTNITIDDLMRNCEHQTWCLYPAFQTLYRHNHKVCNVIILRMLTKNR